MDVPGRVGRLEVQMEQVQEGIANYRQFQKDAREFFTEFKTNEEHRKRKDAVRSKFHFTLLGLLCALIVALFTFLLSHFDGKKASFWAAPSVQSSQMQHAKDE